jgi:hypothetical protein
MTHQIGYFVCATFVTDAQGEGLERRTSNTYLSLAQANRLARRLRRRLSLRARKAALAVVEIIDIGTNAIVWRETVEAR